MSVTHLICPYTLKPLADLKNVNTEHIFADALGGTGDYIVKVDALANSRLGAGIDVDFINSSLIAPLRTRLGIKTRSGPPQWKLRGKTQITKRDVEVVFNSDGGVEIRYIKPIEFAPSGKTATIIIAPEKRDAFLAEFSANMKRKGKEFTIGPEVSGTPEKIILDASVQLDELKRGLIKIAYLAAYEFLGDVFLSDPLIPEWHKAIFAPSSEVAMSAKIHGTALEPNGLFDVVLPNLQEHEHAVAVFDCQQQGPIVIVRLFGSALLTSCIIASETSTYGLNPLDGKIVICDTKARACRTIDFSSHFIARSENIGTSLQRIQQDRPRR